MLVLLPQVALATSFAPPATRDVWSTYRGAMVHVDPVTDTWTVYSAKDLNHPLWSFERPVWHEEVTVSEDGQIVAIASWHFVQVQELDEPGLEWWTSSGKEARSVRALVSHPARVGMGPIGPQWRTWREPMGVLPDEIVLTTTGLWSYRFGWDGELHSRSLSPVGASMRAMGAVGWGILLGLLGLAEAERRAGTPTWRIAVLLLATGAGAGWLGVYLAGAPVPAELLVPVDWALWLFGLFALPVALITALRSRWRLLWLALGALLWLEVLTLPLTLPFLLWMAR